MSYCAHPLLAWLLPCRALLRSCVARMRNATLAGALLLVAGSAQASTGLIGHASCHGRWPNPITDICWQCIFPISFGAFPVGFGQEDIENPPLPVCACPLPVPPFIRIGLEIGFWEPARVIEHTRTPFCFPSLGGLYLGDANFYAPPGAQSSTGKAKVSRDSFYQSHVYLNPVLVYLNVLLDASCMEAGSFDLAYMSEFDFAWHDDAATAVLEPEAVVFSNLLAIASCAADCVMSSIGFGFATMFWCSGCNGQVYPMSGNVPVHIGGVQASALLNHRVLAKLHRLGMAWQWHGITTVCHGHPNPLMDKRGYKTQMMYPVPMTFGTDGSGLNRCCQPLGRTTQIWGMGREFPVLGEDFTYQVFRKRNCCMTP